MNNLEVKTINIAPAKIEFNFEQIEAELLENLKHYKSLAFTDDSATEIRKVLAEIRKGKTAIDLYRKKIKKELNEPVEEFENKIKSLAALFDDTINPLSDQLAKIVTAAREDKRKELIEVRIGIIKEMELTDEQAGKLVIDESMLAASKSIGETTDTLKFQAEKLIAETEQLNSNKLVIKQSIELANARHKLGLTSDPYIELLQFQTVTAVVERIDLHIKSQLMIKEQEEKKKKQQLEKEQAEKELEAQKQEEKDELEKQIELNKSEAEKEQTTTIEYYTNNPGHGGNQPGKEAALKEHIETAAIDPIEDIPFTPSIDDLPFGDVLEEYTSIYTITATEEEHETLEAYLIENGIIIEGVR